MREKVKIKKRGKTDAKKLEVGEQKKIKAKGFSVVKGKKGKNRLAKTLSIALPVCAFVIAAVIIGSIAPTGIVEWFKTRTAALSSSTFPVKYEDSNAKKAYFDNNQISVLTSTDVICYNTKGNKIFQNLHGYAKPVVRTSDLRTLVYNLNANQYKIVNASGTLISKKTDKSIICGDISNSGVYALATESDDDVAEVTVYNKNSTPIYRYHSSSFYITDISLSENGKKLCVATVSSKNAAFASKVMVYNFSSVYPVATKELNGEIVYTTAFANENCVRIITDKKLLSMNMKGETKDYSFESKKLQKFEFSENGDTLLCLAADENSENNSICILNSSAEMKNNFQFQAIVKSVSMFQRNIFILSENTVSSYSVSGELAYNKNLNNGAVAVKAISNGAVLLYASGVEKIAASQE